MKLDWSSEIELPQPDKAISGQRFLLHTGGGVVTIAVAEGDKGLKIQEIDAQTGNVWGESQISNQPPQNARELDQALLKLQRQLKRIELESKAAAEQTQKLLNERGQTSAISKRGSNGSVEYEDLGGGRFRDVTEQAGVESYLGAVRKRLLLRNPSKP